MPPVVFEAALDVEGAISASAAGGLARGLVIAALAVIFVLGVRKIISSLGKSKSSNSASQSANSMRPGSVVLASASAVGIVGSLIGLVSASTNRSILTGDGLAESVTSGLGLWSGLSLVVFTLALILSVNQKISSRANTISLLTGIALATTLVIGMSISGDLPRPASYAQALGTLNDSVTATAVVTPGASGPNSLRVGLSGPDEEVEAIRQLVAGGLVSVTLVSLELDTRSEPVTLTLDDRGGLYAEELVANGSGRWRIQIDLGEEVDLLILDVTLAPNPGYVN